MEIQRDSRYLQRPNIQFNLQLTPPPQVIFDSAEVKRRKSSLVPSANPSDPPSKPTSTQCFVHSLIQKHEGIPETAYDLSYEGLAQERLLDKDPHKHSEQAAERSRLLTKKQISDMVFGIRELSKKLAQMRLQLSVRNVFILGKPHDEKLVVYSREMTGWLLKKYKEWNVYDFQILKMNT